jgi:hypothetical protein
VRAVLSEPFSIGLGRPTRPAKMRAFLAVGSYDADGPEWLGRPARETIAVVAGDGTTKRLRARDPSFFPMTRTVRPVGPPIVMHLAAWPAPWRSVGYVGAQGALCTAAAPHGERLIKPTLLQCSSPLAVVNGLSRFGAAVYFSNPNPRRERGRRSVAAFGFARADAIAVALVDQAGRRFRADLSRPWATAVRRPGDLAGVRGPLRRRLAALPRRIRLRSYVASLSLPPDPDRGRGLRLEVRLRDGTVLRTAGR